MKGTKEMVTTLDCFDQQFSGSVARILRLQVVEYIVVAVITTRDTEVDRGNYA